MPARATNAPVRNAAAGTGALGFSGVRRPSPCRLACGRAERRGLPGFQAARTVSGAPPRSRLCGVSGNWEPPPALGPSDGAAGGVLAPGRVPGAPALCPRDAGARRAREGGDEPPRHAPSTGCPSPARARPCDGQVRAGNAWGAGRWLPAGPPLGAGLQTPQDLLAWGRESDLSRHFLFPTALRRRRRSPSGSLAELGAETGPGYRAPCVCSAFTRLPPLCARHCAEPWRTKMGFGGYLGAKKDSRRNSYRTL